MDSHGSFRTLFTVLYWIVMGVVAVAFGTVLYTTALFTIPGVASPVIPVLGGGLVAVGAGWVADRVRDRVWHVFVLPCGVRRPVLPWLRTGTPPARVPDPPSAGPATTGGRSDSPDRVCRGRCPSGASSRTPRVCLVYRSRGQDEVRQ
jgi:hypothetical protein